MVNIFSHGDYHTLHFQADGKRCTFDLGNATLQAAEQVKRCIEDILASNASGTEPDTDTALWLLCLHDEPYAQLVDAGLVPARPSRESVLEGYLGMFTARPRNNRWADTLTKNGPAWHGPTGRTTKWQRLNSKLAT
jgi:hypothetical protein